MSKIRVEEWESDDFPESNFSLKDSIRNLSHDLVEPQKRPRIIALGGATLLTAGLIVQSVESMMIEQSGHINELSNVLEGSGVGFLILAGITYLSVRNK